MACGPLVLICRLLKTLPTVLTVETHSHYVLLDRSRVESKTMVTQTYFLKPLFRGNLDPFVNNANLGAIAHTSNGT